MININDKWSIGCSHRPRIGGPHVLWAPREQGPPNGKGFLGVFGQKTGQIGRFLGFLGQKSPKKALFRVRTDGRNPAASKRPVWLHAAEPAGGPRRRKRALSAVGPADCGWNLGPWKPSVRIDEGSAGAVLGSFPAGIAGPNPGTVCLRLCPGLPRGPRRSLQARFFLVFSRRWRDFDHPFCQFIHAAGTHRHAPLTSRTAPETWISRTQTSFRQKVLADVLAKRSFNLFSQFLTLNRHVCPP
jgi:hypothetical protein